MYWTTTCTISESELEFYFPQLWWWDWLATIQKTIIMDIYCYGASSCINDFNSSLQFSDPALFNYFSLSPDDAGHSCSDQQVSTPHTSQTEDLTSDGSSKHCISAKHSCMSLAPAPAGAGTQVANITSKVHDLLLTSGSFSQAQHEDKNCCRDVHYHNKEAQWSHECWKAEHDATKMGQKQELELQMENLKQLEMEVQLACVKQTDELFSWTCFVIVFVFLFGHHNCYHMSTSYVDIILSYITLLLHVTDNHNIVTVIHMSIILLCSSMLLMSVSMQSMYISATVYKYQSYCSNIFISCCLNACFVEYASPSSISGSSSLLSSSPFLLESLPLISPSNSAMY